MELLINDGSNQENSKRTPISAKILIALTGGVGIGLTVVCASFVAPAFRRYCLPYVPATTEQVKNVLSFLPKNASGKLIDIGSGDGRIVIAAAQHGIAADGVELNPWLVLYSRLSALRQSVGKRTNFFRRDLWKLDIKPYKYIVIFGVEQMVTNKFYYLIFKYNNLSIFF